MKNYLLHVFSIAFFFGFQLLSSPPDAVLEKFNACQPRKIASFSWREGDHYQIVIAPEKSKRAIIMSKTGDMQIEVPERDTTGSITQAAWRPNGSDLVLTTDKSEVYLCTQDRSRKLPLVLSGHWFAAAAIRSLAWNSNGSRLALGMSNSVAHLVNSPGAQLRRVAKTLKGHEIGWIKHSEIESISWSPDDALVATGANDNTLRIWDASNGNCLRILKHEGAVQSLSWNDDSQRIVSSSYDGGCLIWYLRESREATSCSVRVKKITWWYSDSKKLIWLRNGQLIVAGDKGGAIQIIDPSTRLVRKKIDIQQGIVESSTGNSREYALVSSMNLSVNNQSNDQNAQSRSVSLGFNMDTIIKLPEIIISWWYSPEVTGLHETTDGKLIVADSAGYLTFINHPDLERSSSDLEIV